MAGVQSTRELKTMVRGAYDIQKLRIQMGNRIVGNFKAKLGLSPSTSEDEMDAKGKEILKDLRAHFKKITDGVKSFPRKATFQGDELISTYTELVLLSQYIDLERAEDKHFSMLGQVLKDYKIYNEFLEGVRGIGPAMAGVIISGFDISKAKHPSSLWKYSGLDVAEDGRGRTRKPEHLVERNYIDRNGEEAVRMGITFNPFMRTKLIGVLGGSFLRAGASKKDGDIVSELLAPVEVQEPLDDPNLIDDDCMGDAIIVAGAKKYAKIYRDYKNRLEHRPDLKDETKGHRHNMAMRYMVKMFLLDLHPAWRKIEGLPVSRPYYVDKLGIAPHKDV